MIRGRRSGSSFLVGVCFGTCACIVPSWGASIVSFGARESGNFVIEDSSLDGSVLVGTVEEECSETFSVPRAFRWTAETGMQRLSFVPDCFPGGEAKAVSADGSTVVGHVGGVAFRWTESDGMQAIVTGPPPSVTAVADAVSADGSVVAGTKYFNLSNHAQAFLWTSASGWRPLDTSPHLTHTIAISADGSLVLGDIFDGIRFSFFRWTEATGLEVIPEDPADPQFLIDDVAPDASIFAGYQNEDDGTRRPYRWTLETGYEALLPPPTPYDFAYPLSVSHDGATIVGSRIRANVTESFLWTEEDGPQFLPLEPSPAMFRADRISMDGKRLLGRLTFSDDPEELRAGPAIKDEGRDAILLADELRNYGVDLEGRWLFDASGMSLDGSRIFGIGLNASGEVEAWVADLDGCRDTQEEAIIAGAPRGPRDPAANIILDSSASNVGLGDPGDLVSRVWEIVSGPGVILGATDALTAEIQPTGLGSRGGPPDRGRWGLRQPRFLDRDHPLLRCPARLERHVRRTLRRRSTRGATSLGRRQGRPGAALLRGQGRIRGDPLDPRRGRIGARGSALRPIRQPRHGPLRRWFDHRGRGKPVRPAPTSVPLERGPRHAGAPLRELRVREAGSRGRRFGGRGHPRLQRRGPAPLLDRGHRSWPPGGLQRLRQLRREGGLARRVVLPRPGRAARQADSARRDDRARGRHLRRGNVYRGE